MTETTNNTKTLTDEDTGAECLYVDGVAWPSKGEETVYATDIHEYANGALIRFDHIMVSVDWDKLSTWPDLLDDALRYRLVEPVTPEN